MESVRAASVVRQFVLVKQTTRMQKIYFFKKEKEMTPRPYCCIYERSCHLLNPLFGGVDLFLLLCARRQIGTE